MSGWLTKHLLKARDIKICDHLSARDSPGGFPRKEVDPYLAVTIIAVLLHTTRQITDPNRKRIKHVNHNPKIRGNETDCFNLPQQHTVN